ncbi:unannotated protein [freshwater metagenome]|uniref:Unannotated protein n=1 Tax=freshwater metagenome TaxID=449393 RepID=A0A6J5ZF46_9ZZZZ
MGWVLRSQKLLSLTRLTARALGAQTENAVPRSAPSESRMICAPSASHKRSWRPSEIKWKSNSPRVEWGLRNDGASKYEFSPSVFADLKKREKKDMRNLKALPAQCEQLCPTTLLDQGEHMCEEPIDMLHHRLNPLPESYRRQI